MLVDGTFFDGSQLNTVRNLCCTKTGDFSLRYQCSHVAFCNTRRHFPQLPCSTAGARLGSSSSTISWLSYYIPKYVKFSFPFLSVHEHCIKIVYISCVHTAQSTSSYYISGLTLRYILQFMHPNRSGKFG